MHARNHWDGSFEINGDVNLIHNADYDRSREMDLVDRAAMPVSHQLDETQQSWLLGQNDNTKKKSKYVDLGCIVCSRKALKYTLWAVVAAFFLIALPIIIVKTLPHHKSKPPPLDNHTDVLQKALLFFNVQKSGKLPKSNRISRRGNSGFQDENDTTDVKGGPPRHESKAPPPDNYTAALHKALLFFNAQKSGKLPKSNGISWRGNSGLQDGNDTTDVKGGLVGGYYDGGDNAKFHFPMSFAMTMLSWSVIEYSHKYKAVGEYDHVRELIKWGTDYLLLTFHSSATEIDKIYSQVGGSRIGSTIPDDHYCWQRPEDMDYPRPVQVTTAGPDLAGEMAATLASASIVFRDNPRYSKKLAKGAKTLFSFARDSGRRRPYCRGNPYVEPYYNSSGYYDEYMWASAWLYYVTGNNTYLSLATNPGLSKNSKAFSMRPDLSVLSWDNKLPAAMLLLTRMRIMLSPGYPYEEMLRKYQKVTELNMCSHLKQYHVFNWTKGGMIKLNNGKTQPLQYVANAAFLSSLFIDYLNATGVPGFYCGTNFVSSDVLRSFATSQINYILGDNPMEMSYVVGYGENFPRHVHHRAASMPSDKIKYSCTGGMKWRETKNPNPHNITGAMVGGPDRFEQFHDVRANYSYTEPTLAANAGLVAALVSLTTSGGREIDKNTIFSAVPPLYPDTPPPPPLWKP